MPGDEEVAQQAGHGHEAQAADFDQAKDHRLPEAAPLGPGIEQAEPGDAGGAGGGEHGWDHARAAAVSRGEGQAQKQRAQQNQDDEAQRQQLVCAQGPAGLRTFQCHAQHFLRG